MAVKNDPYFNALQVKYSYAITCHKSQGGQWKKVFVEQPYLPDGPSVAYLDGYTPPLQEQKSNCI